MSYLSRRPGSEAGGDRGDRFVPFAASLTSRANLTWCGGRLGEEFGPQYLGGFMGQWRCFRCGREAPFSWWRSFVLAAREELLARCRLQKDLLAGHGPVEPCGTGSVAAQNDP